MTERRSADGAVEVRIYAVRRVDRCGWTIVGRDAAKSDIAAELRAGGFDPSSCRHVSNGAMSDPPPRLIVYSADEASPFMPEGWRYDELTRCWRAPGQELAFCGERGVRIMCDLYADGVWDVEGASTVADHLPITSGLLARLRAWQAWYDRDYEEDGFDLAAFAAEGLATARAVKAELPDWTVIYFDESQPTHDRPRSTFEYEIASPSEGAE